MQLESSLTRACTGSKERPQRLFGAYSRLADALKRAVLRGLARLPANSVSVA